MKFEELEIYIPTRKPPSNFKDLTGTETKYFKIINRAPNGKNYSTRWNCQCKACGEYCIKEGTNIHRDQSCGCLRKQNIGKALRKDLTNKRFGKLTAIQYSGKSNVSGNAIWICQCECGNKCEVDSNNLTTLHTYSCGCIKYSVGVQNILNLLENNNIAYQMEYAIPGEYEGHPYRFDFAIFNDNNKLIHLVEFDGEQHYRNNGGYMNAESLNRRQERDNRKNKWAIDNNIPLVRIPYWERDKITLEMILGSTYEVREAGQPTG